MAVNIEIDLGYGAGYMIKAIDMYDEYLLCTCTITSIYQLWLPITDA